MTGKFEVSRRVVRLAESLIAEGFGGTVVLTNSYATGTKKLLNGQFSLRLSGFCKESLYIVEDPTDGEIGFFGRYALHSWYRNPTVESIVDLAWNVYLSYKSLGYTRPVEFEKLFIKYGYLTEKTIKVLEERE